MLLIGLGALGVVLGMVGSEILRAKAPKLISKVEAAAKRAVDRVFAEASDDESPTEKNDEEDVAR